MTTKFLRLGRFQTEALLGQGGATETYRARLAEVKPGSDERRFVITLLRGESGRADAQTAARFIATARLLAGLDQSGFVRVFEISEGPGPIYAVHEFKAGVDLAQLRGQAAPKGFMDARLVGLLARKIAERLAALHARPQAPRLHGGLNPGNVLISPEGEVLLLDCGLAEAVRPRDETSINRWFFAAPEQIFGAAATPASDLYSIGALIFFLFAGKPPFMAYTGDALREKMVAGVLPLPQMPSWLFAVMARLLSSDPSLRQKSAADVVRQISAAMLAAEAGGAAAAPRAPGPSGAAQPGSKAGPRAQAEAAAPADPGRSASSVVPSKVAAPVQASAPGGTAARETGNPSTAGGERVVPFAFDETITEDERPRAAARAAAAKKAAAKPVVPFSLETSQPAHEAEAEDDDHESRGLAWISADDPDVGAVYDDDDDVEEEVVVGPDGKVKRRLRRRLQIPAWYRSPLARKMSRMALIPLAVLLVVGAVVGVFFHREWATTRAQTEVRNAQLQAEVARRAAELRPPQPPEPPSLPPGQVMVKTKPGGAAVWLDGVEKPKTPATIYTAPGSHRLVVTLPGYRMLRDVVDSTKGLLWEREMLAAPHLDDGRVPLSVGCVTENKYPIYVDGKDSGELCPASDLRIEPGRHSIGVFVIPQNRIWTFDREVQINRPHRVQFNY